jgi:hypothetical protein
MAVDVKTDEVSFEAGIPRLLFEVALTPIARRPWNRRASRFRCG